jgi:hypothetical protein
MVPLMQLWLPILLSAVGVFIASSLIHMVIKWHNGQYFKLSNEDEVRAVLRKGNPAPGQYVIPYCKDGGDMRNPEMQQKFVDGPIAMMMVRPTGPPAMGKMLGAWFVFTLFAALFAAYLASVTIAPGAASLHVFRVVATVSFLTYGGGTLIDAIWMGLPWRAAFAYVLDAVVYAAVSGGVFVYFWPH